MRKTSTKRLVESGVMLALGFVLSLFKVKIIPTGGSVTFASMLPIVLIAYRYGARWGTLVGAIHGMLQMLEGGISTPPTQNALSFLLVILLDYIIAWALVGLFSGLIMKALTKPNFSLASGAALGIFGRFLSSTLSGVIIWGVYAPEGQNVWVYSISANALVLLPELIITTIVAFVLFSFPAMRDLFRRETPRIAR